MTEDRIARARTVLRFLNGEGPLDGHWFGERPAGDRPYWWRKHLDDILAALASLPDDVSEEREIIAKNVRSKLVTLLKAHGVEKIDWSQHEDTTKEIITVVAAIRKATA